VKENRKMRYALLSGSFWILLAGCRSWDGVRKDFIDPVNQFLHKDHARAWEATELRSLLELCSPELAGDPAFVERKKSVLARFVDIEYATSIIDTVDQLDGEEKIRARVFLRLRGLAAGGRRVALDEWLFMDCEHRDEGWRITGEQLISEDIAYSKASSFTEEAEARGITFKHNSRGVIDKNGNALPYSAGSGLAVGDYDGDNDEDIFLIGGAESRLYRNRGDGRFEDATDAAQVFIPPRGETRCATFADYDSDGDMDLFVGVLDAPNLLFRNRGDSTFEEVGADAGLIPTFETVAAAFADFNGDNHLDLYLVNGGNLYRKHPEPIHNALNAAPNVLYLSNGDGTFKDYTEESGTGHTGWGLALSTTDYDLDGDQDIVVGNDVGYNVLYRNRGDAVFDDVTFEAGIRYRGSTMSVSVGDVNGDGYPDIFTAAMDSNSRWMIDQPGFPCPAPWFIEMVLRGPILGILKEMLYGNRFYMSNGDGTFTEVAEASGVRRNGWAWAAVFLDHDNDCLLDIYAVNGFLSGDDPKDL
jgi:hypothetical protein